MKKIINKIRTSIWLYPTIYSLFAFVLSISITIIDKTCTDESLNYVNELFYTTSSLAQAVLSIIAGAFITISTFTFSTTMVVLTMYSSQFTPRVVENFLNNKTTMKSFGIFLSGFIYAITSLLFIDTNKDGNLVIAASVGVIYIIVGLVYFLLFINNVSTHIQASDLISRLHEEAIGEIEKYTNFAKESEIISEVKLKKITDKKNFIKIFARSDGYIQEINYQRLKKFAQKYKCIVCFKKVVGQFVSTETRILIIYFEGFEDFTEIVLNELHQCILIGNKKTQAQDFSFTIQKIVEIALKALSPGINDPNTAVHCLKIIGVLLRNLANIEKGYIILKDQNEFGFIIYEAFDFKVLLYDAYNQIMFYGQKDVSIVVAGFKSLRFIKAKASQNNREIIDEYAKHVFNKRENKVFGKLEFSKIQKEFNDLLNF
ncbi:MAG: DUF2254 domain-containing protein [Acetobacterium sp.]|uniref:DUF2254 domain-containing protein n=1 Tax=Acetobacterium sp. TaxID=1872094 RepID=UPI003242F531